MPPVKARTPELQARILTATIDAYSAEGVGAVTTRRVAELAGTSAPAIYELFGDKAGLVRAMFFEGFRRLAERFEHVPAGDHALADLAAVVDAFRSFSVENPHLFRLMYSRPFEVFAPGPDELDIGTTVRAFIVSPVRRAVDEGVLHGDPTDIAHGLLALALGLATQETGGWLGSTAAARDRRWRTAVDHFLAGAATPGD